MLGDSSDEVQPQYIIAPNTEASDGDQVSCVLIVDTNRVFFFNSQSKIFSASLIKVYSLQTIFYKIPIFFKASTSGIIGLDVDYSYITNTGNLLLNDTSGVVDNNMGVNPSTILQIGSEMLQGANKLLPEGMYIDMSQLSIVTSNGVVSYMTTPSSFSLPTGVAPESPGKSGINNNKK